jgi:hypothetical protein
MAQDVSTAVAADGADLLALVELDHRQRYEFVAEVLQCADLALELALARSLVLQVVVLAHRPRC